MLLNMFKDNNKNTRTPLSTVSTVDFEQLNVSWEEGGNNWTVTRASNFVDATAMFFEYAICYQLLIYGFVILFFS